MSLVAEAITIEQELLALKKYLDLLHGSWQTVRGEIPLISERLKVGTGHKDVRAHSRAYHDLSLLVRKLLVKIPEKPPTIPVFERPKSVARAIERAKKGDVPIPIVNTGGTICMGCFYCDDWIDITPIFTENKVNAVYQCPNDHRIVFGGIKKELAENRKKMDAGS